MSDTPEFLDSDGLAKFLNVGRQMPRQWRLTGKGPAYYKLGRSVRYTTRGALEWAERHLRTSTKDTETPDAAA